MHPPKGHHEIDPSFLNHFSVSFLTHTVFLFHSQALEGFLFVVNPDGYVNFCTENIKSFIRYSRQEVSISMYL
jgi:hypothetical protein